MRFWMHVLSAHFTTAVKDMPDLLHQWAHRPEAIEDAWLGRALCISFANPCATSPPPRAGEGRQEDLDEQ